MNKTKPDPSSPVSLHDIAYALDHLAPDVPTHVDSRATEALKEIERLLWVFEPFQSSATPIGALIHQILIHQIPGVDPLSVEDPDDPEFRVSDTDGGAP